MTEPPDDIDELVDWQLAQGRRRGYYTPPLPANRTVAHSTVARTSRKAWVGSLRRVFVFRP